MSKLSAETITDSQIQQLREEAKQHGDKAMVRICNRAIAGNKNARALCAEAHADARAMDDDYDY